MENFMIHVSIVESDDGIRENLSTLINGASGYICQRAYRDVEHAIDDIIKNRPDVLLLDIDLSGLSGIEGVRSIKARAPDLQIIMLSTQEDQTSVFDALSNGACGYLMKNISPVNLLDAINEAYNGGAPMSKHVARMVVDSFKIKSFIKLTRRESEVLTQLCYGKSYRKIAEALSISVGTVRRHLNSIYKKLDVGSNSEAVIKALKQRLIRL
jgi:DNA-binding NarL/FixJ family response regulator